MQTLIDHIRYWMRKPEKPALSSAPEAKFQLIYDGQSLGMLSFKGGIWTFAYSDEFRQQSHLRPIVVFPDINKVYQCEELWPFFAMRIPSLKQTQIHDVIVKENIDEGDEVKLLQRFGKRTIANP